MSKRTNSSLRNARIFDPWNTTATGHQRTENTYARTVSWREMRHEKLAKQFGENPHRAVNNYYNNNDGHRGTQKQGSWEWVSEEEAHRQRLRREGMRDIRDFFMKSKPASALISTSPSGSSSSSSSSSSVGGKRKEEIVFCPSGSSSATDDVNSTETGSNSNDKPKKKIFSNLTFYINGSTFPDISDHKLKYLISEHGGRIALHLSRRGVTHVILGRNHRHHHHHHHQGDSSQQLALAAGKIQRELSRGGAGSKGTAMGTVRFVGVDW